MVFNRITKRNRRFCIKITKLKQWFFHRRKQNNRWLSRKKRNRTIGFSCQNLWFSTSEPSVSPSFLQSCPQMFIVYPQSAITYQQAITVYPQAFSAVLHFSKTKTTGSILPNRWFVERAAVVLAAKKPNLQSKIRLSVRLNRPDMLF